ncbi:MAG TPA: hypothetical protein PLS69_11970, partial [Terricaulis sp.]|nr:hypothetical protein [Terricaulis sp.]
MRKRGCFCARRWYRSGPADGRGDIGDLLVRILIGIVVLLAAFFVFAPSMLDPRGAYVPGVMQGRTLVLKGDAFRS